MKVRARENKFNIIWCTGKKFILIAMGRIDRGYRPDIESGEADRPGADARHTSWGS
jgi:hypothetical protein